MICFNLIKFNPYINSDSNMWNKIICWLLNWRHDFGNSKAYILPYFMHTYHYDSLIFGLFLDDLISWSLREGEEKCRSRNRNLLLQKSLYQMRRRKLRFFTHINLLLVNSEESYGSSFTCSSVIILHVNAALS